ncbi:methyltransferase domain-containing protein [Bdellovibrionota bacterium FG-1]
MPQSPSVVWRLRPGADRRFRSGHPWVYSNELAASPKGVEPGALVELRDAKDAFLARGYGNAASLIAFRALSRDPGVTAPDSVESILRTLHSAQHVREVSGISRWSHRLCFGESDRIPGLVIDRYVLAEQAQVYVVQAHTAGAQRLIPKVWEALEWMTNADSQSGGPRWNRTALVLRNDVGVRKLEGLEVEDPVLVRAIPGMDLSEAKIQVASVWTDSRGERAIELGCDLVGGQKTGFFLDQFANIQLAALKLRHPLARAATEGGGRPLRILDLCCYVGQWGAQLSSAFRASGLASHVTAVDASEKALYFAKRNIEMQDSQCETLRGDVLKDLASLPSGAFDLVISDPPALIKGRKDLGPGTHAYLQLHTQAFRLVRKGGSVVSCSCSALLEEEEFARTLSKAALRNHLNVRWVGRGMQSPDHPVLAEFPEGRYLKCWIGVTD